MQLAVKLHQVTALAQVHAAIEPECSIRRDVIEQRSFEVGMLGQVVSHRYVCPVRFALVLVAVTCEQAGDPVSRAGATTLPA